MDPCRLSKPLAAFADGPEIWGVPKFPVGVIIAWGSISGSPTFVYPPNTPLESECHICWLRRERLRSTLLSCAAPSEIVSHVPRRTKLGLPAVS